MHRGFEADSALCIGDVSNAQMYSSESWDCAICRDLQMNSPPV